MKFKSKYIFNGLIFSALALIFGVYIGNEIPWNNSFLHTFYNICVTFGFLGLLIHTLWEIEDRTEEEYEELLQNSFLPFKFPGRVTTLIVFVIIVHRLILGGLDMNRIYNQNIVYTTQYTQKTQQLQGLYDMTWKVTAQKWKVNDSAKAMGLELTKAIYEGKRPIAGAGFNLLLESKLIPIEEFTDFYKDLSTYIETQRGAYYSLEIERQSIIAQQSILLNTFPNNLYNRILNLPTINYKYGILSDSTNNAFKSGVDNLDK